jgi:chemotaxis protein MotB
LSPSSRLAPAVGVFYAFMNSPLPRRSLILALPALAVGCAARAGNKDSLIYSLDREIIALRTENERLEGRLETCASQVGAPPPIYAELVQILPDLGVEVLRDGDKVLLRLRSDTLFASDSLRLRQESDPILDLLATALGLHPDVRIEIVGHTDDLSVKGRLARAYPSRWELGAAQAISVLRALTEEWGVSPQRLSIGTRAEWAPIAESDTPEGRAENRRIEITLQHNAALESP